MKTSQIKEVLKHLKIHKTITSMEAINLYGATRLSAIIYDLRASGYNIVTHKATDKNRYGNSTTYAVYELITIDNIGGNNHG